MALLSLKSDQYPSQGITIFILSEWQHDQNKGDGASAKELVLMVLVTGFTMAVPSGLVIKWTFQSTIWLLDIAKYSYFYTLYLKRDRKKQDVCKDIISPAIKSILTKVRQAAQVMDLNLDLLFIQNVTIKYKRGQKTKIGGHHK